MSKSFVTVDARHDCSPAGARPLGRLDVAARVHVAQMAAPSAQDAARRA